MKSCHHNFSGDAGFKQGGLMRRFFTLLLIFLSCHAGIGSAYGNTAIIESPNSQGVDVIDENRSRNSFTAEFPEAAPGTHLECARLDDAAEPLKDKVRETPLIAHTVLDRSLFRAGETVHMKHFLRMQTASGFAYPAPGKLPDAAVIEYQGSGQKYEFPLRWDNKGSAVTSWQIPESAGTGTYTILLRKKSAKPSRKAVSSGSCEKEADLPQAYIASGGFRVEKFRVPLMTGVIQPSAMPLVNVKEAQLSLFVSYPSGGGAGGLAVKLKGRVQPQEITFDGYGDLLFSNGEVKEGVSKRYGCAGTGGCPEPEVYEIPARELKLDDGGACTSSITGYPAVTAPGVLWAELEFRDPYGEMQTISRSIPLWPSHLLIGVKPDLPILPQNRLKFRVAVVSLRGVPEAGRYVNVDLYKKTSYSRREASAGGSYSYEDVSEITKAGHLCSGRTGADGFLVCDEASPISGDGIIQAEVADDGGNRSVAHAGVSIAGTDGRRYCSSDNDRTGLLPEKNVYEPGETTQALKPGIAEIEAGRRAYELKVSVAADKELYNAREKARVHIMVRKPNGALPPRGSEVAVAAIDEGLLELMANKSWDLLGAMTARRGSGVNAGEAQKEAAGQRREAPEPLLSRKTSETLLLWKARIALNQKGEAVVEVPLNDAASSFRIVAVASGGAGLFGTGQTDIRTSKDLELLSELPDMVREGDDFRAVFRVRNTSLRAMGVDIGAAVGATDKKEFGHAGLMLKPGEAREIGWDVGVPAGIDRMQYEVTAREAGGTARGGLKVNQRVAEAVPSRVVQSFLGGIDGSYKILLERPSNALSAKGSITVALKPKLAGALNGVIAYMKQCPYTGMEQKVSRAVALRDAALWRKVVAELPSSLDSDGLVKYFPSMKEGSDVLTSYIISISDEAGWGIPAPEMDKMEKGLKRFIEGKAVRNSLFPSDTFPVRRVAALEALARAGGAEPGMAASITPEPKLWPTSAVLSWANILLRSPSLPDREKLLKEVEREIRSRLKFQGTVLGFSTEASDGLPLLMVSGDFNAVKSITTLLHFGGWKHDMPRLVRGALDRQQQGRWTLTTADAWGVLAMEKYSRMYEFSAVTGSTVVAVNGKEFPQQWSKYPDGKIMRFPWTGDRTEISLRHDAKGSPWAAVQGSIAVPGSGPFADGFKIAKTLIPVECRTAGAWSRGDVVMVRLEIEARSDMNWVAVTDPVPAGAEITGTGRGGAPRAPGNDEQLRVLQPASEDRSDGTFRAYYEFVPKGRWIAEYAIRLNDSGTFHLPPTHVEALYSPEVSGDLPNAAVTVAQ